MSTKSTNDSTFDQDIKSSNIPVVVDFWAEWCGPSKQIGPILQEIGDAKKDKLKIFKLKLKEKKIALRHNKLACVVVN